MSKSRSEEEPLSEAADDPGAAGSEVGTAAGDSGAGRRPRSRWTTLLVRAARNWFSLVGMVLCITGATIFLFLAGVEVMLQEAHPYLGVILLFIPPFILIGLGLMGFGSWYQRRQERAGREPGDGWWVFDVERRTIQQRVILLVGGLSAISVFLMAVGSIKAHEFTESNTFCGQICHAVMTPEYVAYQHSAHARVRCVECHVGSGASFYVRSKLSGLYQVYAYAADVYPRPIPAPIESLRPAQDTCEQCHWPRYFFGARQTTRTYYLSEGGADPWEVDLLVKIGGGDPERGFTQGIHWHMNIANRVEYVARDEERQDIPWVRLTDPLGNVTVYTDTEEPPTEELLASGEVRVMDCMDCHNRPSHVFRSPVTAVNRELELGNLDPTVPEIKLNAIELLADEYDSRESAGLQITERLRERYHEDYPDYYADNRVVIDRAAVTLRRVFADNVFPEMGVRWSVYPDNIGHWDFPGCFRCHDGSLRSGDGRIVSTACETCHTISWQGYRSERGVAEEPRGGEFIHPPDGEVMEAPILCHECHDGALGF